MITVGPAGTPIPNIALTGPNWNTKVASLYLLCGLAAKGASKNCFCHENERKLQPFVVKMNF